jgi:hypothetical protein
MLRQDDQQKEDVHVLNLASLFLVQKSIESEQIRSQAKDNFDARMIV